MPVQKPVLVSGLWGFLQDRVVPAFIFIYQVAALLTFAIVPLLASRWLATPFLGAFVEHTLIVNTSRPTHLDSGELRQADLPFGYQLQSIAGQPVRSSAEMRYVLRQFQPGERVPVLVLSPHGEERVFNLTLQIFPQADRWTYLYIPYLIGIIYALSSIWVFSLRRKDAAGRAFALFTASVGIALAGLFDTYTTHKLTYLWTLAVALTGGSLFNLAMLFPQELRLVVRYPFLRWLGYLPAAALAGYAVPTLHNLAAPLAYARAWQLEFFFAGAGAVFFLIWTVVRCFTSPSPVARDQARLILAGSAVAFIPLVAWFFLTAFRPAFTFTAYLLLPLAAFPLVTAYAILRYRLLNTDYMLSRALLYALLSVLAICTYALLVTGLSLVFGDLLEPDNPYLIGTMVFVLAAGLNPLRSVLQRSIDALFFHGQAAYRERLQGFGRELARCMDLAAILQLVRQEVETALLPAQLHIYIQAEGEQYAAACGPQDFPSSDLRFAAGSALVQALARRGGPIFISEEITLPAELQPDRARLALLGANLFVPLPGRQGLAGWLALGPRRSGEHYTVDALAYLESVSSQAALAVERAQVVADLERRMHQMDTITRVAEGINITLAFDDLLEMFYAQTNRLIPTRDFRITLKNEGDGELAHVFCLENDERLRERENQPLPDGQGLEAEVVRTQRALVTEDYERECYRRGQLPDLRGVFAWMGIPLNAGSGTFGAVSLASRDPAMLFTAEQLDLLQAIADLAAGAIVNARLLEETELRARQLATLNEVARSLTSTLELDPLLELILKSAVDILASEAGSLLLVDERTGESVFTVAVGPVGAELVGQRLPPGAGLVGRAIATGQPIIQNDVRRSEQWFDTDRQTGYSTQDLLVVPMQVKERVIGVIEVLNKRDRSAFTPDDLQLLAGFAGQAAVAIENARLYTLTDQALAARVEELAVMQRIDRELNASLELERALRITLEWSMRQSKADAGLVGILNGSGLRIVASQGYSHELEGYDSYLPREISSVEAAIRSGQPQSTAGRSDPAQAGACLLPGGGGQLVIPIQREGRAIGLILLESLSQDAFPEDRLAFLSRLSDHAAIAVANAQLYTAVQAANLAKSQFVSAAAHELKNPLTSIKGYSDLLAAGAVGPVSESQAGFLVTIRSNAERMSTLVSDLQDISRIEAGQLRLQFSAVPLAGLAAEVQSSLGKQIEAKEQRLEIEIPAGLPPLWGDGTRLVQILTNLVSNAHKYTPRGGRIKLRAKEAANEWDPQGAPQVMHISVQDTGIGIGPEDQKRLFQQFFRSEDPKVREVTGTGLGLSITKNLVELQGGRIWFESALDQGTTFHFTIPVAEK